MGRKNKGKFSSGTFISRELLHSEAFLRISNSAKFILGSILLKRRFTKQHDILNQRDITLTYKELEARGMSRSSITRGINDLLEKGFIEIVHQGGAFQRDKSIYAVIDAWALWKPGQVMNKRVKGRSTGSFALNKHQSNKNEPPI